MSKLLTVLLILLISLTSLSQKTERIAFYNVENLFDTIDGPNNDSEFLPSGKKLWNSDKYFEKINHINKVLCELNSPMLVGFCEVENVGVLNEIIGKGKALNGYKTVHYDSDDARGIDAGMIYNAKKLRVIDQGYIRYILPGQTKASSRDIVWAKFSYKKELFYVMVNHWPSRRGGTEKSEPKRLKAAQSARNFIDSLLALDASTKIVLMGDLNDYPSNKSVKLITEKLEPKITSVSNKFNGTHNYRGEWNILDHICISDGWNKGRLKSEKADGHILTLEYMLSTYKVNIVPFRTYGGSKYLGGYSDHLPVYINLKFK
jgi:predicted extracellular nuclease